jgi:1-acyl-sn-glycerol-3-phosphate acyltransferase
MIKLLQILFFLLIVRPLMFVIIGLNIQGKEHLPLTGPAIVAANHNSHLDTLALLSLWPLVRLGQIRPVAAADYFLPNPVIAWFSLNIMRVIPIDRHRKDKNSDPLADCSAALSRGEILVIYPEGSRGTPEQTIRFKTGISRLAEQHPEAPIVPIFMHGLGKSLPRGDFLLVPFVCDVLIGDLLYWQGSVAATMQSYQTAMDDLIEQCHRPEWE